MSYDVEKLCGYIVYSLVQRVKNNVIEYHIIEIYHVLHSIFDCQNSTDFFSSKWRTSMKYYFLLITILEADLRYNNNINIVYNDTDDVVTNRR